MDYFSFLLPGDEVIVDSQSMHFHKGRSYPISHVFHDKGNLVVFLKDKNNFDVKIDHHYQDYELTSKARSASDRRMLLERLKELAQDSDYVGYLSKGWGGKDSIYYQIIDATRTYNSACFLSRDELFHLKRYLKDDSNKKYDETELTFGTIELLCDYIEKEIKKEKEDYYMFHVNKLGFDKRKKLDFKSYLLLYNIPVLDWSKVDPPKKIISSYGTRDHFLGMPFDKAVGELSDLLFDSKYATPEQRAFMITVVDAYSNSPASHGATAMSKLLTGKAKKVTDKQEPYNNVNPLGLKQQQMFIITDWVETFCYVRKIFINAKELLDPNTNVVFSSRRVDVDKLKEFKNCLK